ncbi:MAG TPA: hypothetical protein DCY35_07730 [Prolixibacteraceae bacterium]|nr:hypothetical protein [Prolixibacteraceae bacterium]
MDNKKLIQILLRDIADLQELITDMKTSGHADPLDLDLLDTKMAAIRHLMEVIAEREKPSVQHVTPVPSEMKEPSYHRPPVNKPVEPTPSLVVPPVIPEEIVHASEPELPLMADQLAETEPRVQVKSPEERNVESLGNVKPESEQKKSEEVLIPVPQPNQDVKPEHLNKEEAQPVPKVRHQPEPVAELKETPPTLPLAPQADINHQEAWSDDKELELEESAPILKQAFGEKFVQGKSVNDLLLEQAKPDSRFSNLPVSSLQGVIGINDRFLFTRELFDGNGEQFSEAIRKIDSMENIHDAANFLRENYKWKKTETSLKFIELVKRRFI